MTIAAIVMLYVGLFFYTGGSVGIIRFPDFYTRLHPAGKLDTMGLLTTMGALAVYTVSVFGATIPNFLTAAKILLIVVFVFLTSPTATHAIIDAGMRAGLEPWTKEGQKEIDHDLAD